MANIQKKKGVIGILTGGGDVPGLNPAIRAITIRALREGYDVIGIRRGWGGMINIVRDKKADNSENFQYLTRDVVNRAGRTGGTFLHTSRTRPSHVTKGQVPEHLRDTYKEELNDLTPEVLKNLEWLNIDYLIPIGGDDTLSYGPLLKARERLTPEGRWQELRADLVTLSESFNRVPGGFSVPSEFLLARGLRQWAP